MALAAWTVISLLPLSSCGPTALHDIFPRTPAANIDVKAFSKYLSATAAIYLPNSIEFTNYTVRWSNLETPTLNVVVVPGTEKDVVEIVSILYTVFQRKLELTLVAQRSNLRPNMTFQLLLTTVTTVASQRWAKWIMVLRYTSVN
jgi:hypothetical protein